LVKTLNLGILAHVDAGKTSLTERLLYATGVIDEIGSVDAGNTQTDSLELERQRGITIKSAVVSFAIDDVTVNLIDTPGHPDFIAEVERVLSVLDGAVLVVSAVEGVQAQTRILYRTLHRLRIPTMFFINKIDRMGADPDRVLREIREKLTPFATPPNGDLADILTRHDDGLLAAYVDGTITPRMLAQSLAAQSKRALVHPVLRGSAITGEGVDDLIPALVRFLPTVEADAGGPVSGAVFKVERGPAGEKIAYLRLFSGTLHTRDKHLAEKVTSIGVFAQGHVQRAQAVPAGRIAKLWGLNGIRIGDAIGVPPRAQDHHFAPPTLETVVFPLRQADRGLLHAALAQLAEQDPLINLRQDDIRQEISVSLYGEVQKEVIQATLANEFGVAADFRETTTIHIERLVGDGAAFAVTNKPGNPFLATVGLRVEPAAPHSGVTFRLEVEPGSMPVAFFKAVEETVRETLRQGLYGWEIPDCTVTLTHTGYWARQGKRGQTFDPNKSSQAGDFRCLTPLVLMEALVQAGTRVYEPMHRFRIDLPGDTLGAVQLVLLRMGASGVEGTSGSSVSTVEGLIPAAKVHDLQQRLAGLTRGEGVLDTSFDHHRLVRGDTPSRARTDHNPLDRDEYLRHHARHVKRPHLAAMIAPLIGET
jgi:ribosomal protection tetracycline resistance protein